MEKRTLLAFILSFLVLIGWSIIFPPAQQKSPVKEEKRTAQKAASTKTKAHEKGPATFPESQWSASEKRREAFPSPEAREKEIFIDTPLYKSIFTNAGPTVKSFKLKKYREEVDPQSPRVELIQSGDGRNHFLKTGFSVSGSRGGHDILYQVDKEVIKLGPHSSPEDLTFRSVTPEGIYIEQTFRFYPDRYQIDHRITVVNRSGNPIQGAFETNLTAMPPTTKKGYYSFVGLALLKDDKLEQVKIKKQSDKKQMTGEIGWMAYETGYFITAVIPQKPVKAVFEGQMLSSGMLRGTYLSPTVSLGPSEHASSRYLLFFGPRDLHILKDVGKKLDKVVNFGWFDIIAKPLLGLLRFFNKYIHNYGVSIIVLTILIKILFWPLTHKSYKSMKEMQKLQPRLAKIREKYKDNREQMNKEMMALYRTYKVNPMGGCLPMVIQIPVFFALYRLLGSAIELRHAPFMLWINDLSAPDRLFNFPFHVPLMAPPYGIPVLTLLMGASMYIQQKMTPSPGDPTQAKVMMFLPIIFTFLFINFPSGLVLYWLVNNILSIGQQYRIQKSVR